MSGVFERLWSLHAQHLDALWGCRDNQRLEASVQTERGIFLLAVQGWMDRRGFHIDTGVPATGMFGERDAENFGSSRSVRVGLAQLARAFR